jgi:two-component sensor histidine kinase
VSAQQSPAALRAGLETATQSSNRDSLRHYLSWLGYYHFSQQNIDSARFYYVKALFYSELTGNNKLTAHSLNSLGLLYSRLGNMDSSFYYFTEAIREYENLRDTAMVTRVKINLGSLYISKALYKESLEHLFEATYKLEKLEPSASLATCYSLIGSVYRNTGEPYTALNYHKKALEVRMKLNLKEETSGSYNNIGNAFMELRHYDSALNNYQKSLRIKREINDKSGAATCLNNMGELLVITGDLAKAEDLLKEALSIRLAINEQQGEASTRNNLGRVHLLRGSLNAAEHELKRNEQMARSLGFLEQLKTNYELQIKLYKKKEDPDNALMYSEQLLVVKDSLLNQEKARSLAEMQTRYESVKKEDRITLLEKEGLLQEVELEQRKIWIRSLVGGIALTFIIGVLIYYNLRTTRKNKIHIELLLKELHHRVKNNLQILSSLLSLQSQQLTDDTALKAVKSSESRINAMALIHRKLYSVDQNRTVDIKEYITELIQYLVYSYGYHEKNLKLDLDINEISIDVDKAIPLGLILNELISNAFKHAYENEPNPRLMVNLAYPNDHELRIRIKDNGGGMPVVDDKKHKTFGMKIVSTLLKELKGSLDVKSGNGTTYDLYIPM